MPAQTQQESLNRFVDKYKKDKAFTFAYMSKNLVEVAAQTDVAEKDWQKLQNMVKNIGSLSILATDCIPNARAVYREALAAVPVAVLTNCPPCATAKTTCASGHNLTAPP